MTFELTFIKLIDSMYLKIYCKEFEKRKKDIFRNIECSMSVQIIKLIKNIHMDFYKYSIPIDIIKHDCADMSFLFFLGD